METNLMTEIGKRIRLERIFNRKTGRTVIAPMDHGVSSGPIKGIINMDETVESIYTVRISVLLYTCLQVPH